MNFLYDEGTNALTDLLNVTVFINDYGAECGEKIGVVRFDASVLMNLLEGMRENFPHIDGLDKSSPFKKAAYFMCRFIADQPIKYQFDCFGKFEAFSDNPRATNTIIAIEIAIESLFCATLTIDGLEKKLVNRIQLSTHSLIDLVEAISNPDHQLNWPLVSILLEQMAYKTNPTCQYKN